MAPDPAFWPSFWMTAPAVLGLLALIFIVAGLRQMTRGRVMLSLTTLLGGAALGALGLALGAVAANFLSYGRLTYERPVAEVSVAAADAADKRYAVTVHALQGSAPPVTCTLQGDEWLLSARVQTWQSWATVIGFDATYVLDQLANKYADAAEANGKPITACSLKGAEPPLVRTIPVQLREWAASVLQVQDRRFGAANYMPLADGALYRVMMTQSGLTSEPANDAARAAAAR